MELRRPALRQLFLWQAEVLLGALLPSLLTSLLFPAGSRPWRLATGLWMALALGLILLYLPGRYLRLGYHLGDDGLLITAGVLYFRTEVLPLSAVQTVRVTATPLQRLAGLRTLRVYAAGARLSVPGLPAAEAVGLAQALLPEGGMWL